ncbi:hypothetical protein [Streptomyces sp. NPDC053720]|uniref:hypothetical protein n=1 Tax=Streptomyces sp. NPDC053720 TaxID=3154855 RepID=UPI003424445F
MSGEDRIAAIQRCLDALRSQHGPTHPDVIQQQMDLAELTGQQGDFRSVADLAAAAATAWLAYRFLDALHTADPHLAATITADAAEQLDDGAISEWAWDAAVDAGYDPQKWQTGAEEGSARRSLPQLVNT